MNSIRRIRRSAAVLAGTLLASITAAPAALASLPPESAGPAEPLVRAHTVVTGGMPGWQITLIAAGPR
jgi:hypothetical protein